MGSKVFEGVSYFIQESKVKSPAEVKQVLKEGSASREFYHSELVTHVIRDLPLSPEEEAVENHHLIVHSDWARMSLKCGAQLPITPFQISTEKLFSSLIFCPSKLTSSDVEKLCVLLLYYGGKMQRRLDSSVTHLVTTETTGAKYDHAREHSEIKIITPDWILDCVDADQVLEEEKYHPALLKTSPAPGTCNGRISLEPNAITPPSIEPEKMEIGVSTNDTVVVVSTETVPVHTGEAPERTTKKELTREDSVEDRREKVNEETVEVVMDPVPARANPASLSGPPEKLLDGIVIFFTDYRECVEHDTLEKWKLVVRQHGGEVMDKYDSSTCTHLLALHKKSSVFSQALEAGKCIASAHWLNDVLTDQKMFSPRNPIHFPTAFKWQLPNAEQYCMALTNYMDLERELVKDMLRICGITYTGHLSRSNTHLICKKPEGKKYEMALEWGVQVVNSRFLADVIHDGLVPTVLLPRYTELNQPNEFSSESSSEASQLLDTWKPFLKQYSLLHPGLLDSAVDSQGGEGVSSLSRKRERPGEAGSTEADQTSTTEEIRTFRKMQKIRPTVLFTGISLSVVKKLKQIVVRLGGVITEKGRECSHLVTPRITRTVKFLSSISVCSCIVTPKWVEECGRRRTFVTEEGFALRDSDMEKEFGMEVATSLSRAKSKKLLEGVSVYSTPTVQPPFSAMKEIVECAGGELVTMEEVRERFLGGLGSGGGNVSGMRLVVLSTPMDIEAGCCKEFTDRRIDIYNAELILTGVLKQMLNFGQYTFVLTH